jgi:hypothetical protein
VFLHSNDEKVRKIIDEFILSSSDNESIKYILRNIDFEAFKLGISFYQMIFILIQKKCYSEQKISNGINDKILKKFRFYILKISSNNKSYIQVNILSNRLSLHIYRITTEEIIIQLLLIY